MPVKLGHHVDTCEAGIPRGYLEAGTPRGSLLLPEWSSLSTGIFVPVLTALLHLQIGDQVARRQVAHKSFLEAILKVTSVTAQIIHHCLLLVNPTFFWVMPLGLFLSPHLWNSSFSLSCVKSSGFQLLTGSFSGNGRW